MGLLKSPAKSGRWPVHIFSHGLGGTKNAYSHILGSLASHGVVVLAPEHRDGSAPLTFVNSNGGRKPEQISYLTVPHEASKQVEEARDGQLKIRLWELALLYDAIRKIDQNDHVKNLAVAAGSAEISNQPDLSMFMSSLDVHEPGSISWSGHSFGAATIIQFIKSVYYTAPSSAATEYQPFFVMKEDSSIVKQITPRSTVALLDLWALPLRSSSKRWLWNKPLPCYTSNGPGGSNVIAILSEAFYKWKGNLTSTKMAVSASPSDRLSNSSKRSPPFIFYPMSSAHLSQSDFGILFPWATRKFMKAEEPERTLRLNVRAILEVMRLNGAQVMNTSMTDMEEATQKTPFGISTRHGNGKANSSCTSYGNGMMDEREVRLGQDWKILAGGLIRGWIALRIDNEGNPGEGANEKLAVDADLNQVVMKEEGIGRSNEYGRQDP